MRKSLNTQNPYNLHKAVCVRTIRLTRKSRTAYAKTHTLRKAVHKHTQKPHNLCTAAYIAQKPYTNVRQNMYTYKKDAHRFVK